MERMPALAASLEAGTLGVCHLKRLWSAAIASRQGDVIDRQHERYLDLMLLNCLGIGLLQTLRYLYETRPDFEQFEAWVVATAGVPQALRVERLNATVAGHQPSKAVQQWLADVSEGEPVFSAQEIAFWHEQGYIILRQAVTPEACRDAADAIWQYVGACPDTPDSWYGQLGNIMVELIQHPALERNRRTLRIHRAFAQLWGTADLWVSADRCGFHPPQRPDWPFPGPDLHWDMDLAQPLYFATQGILYLTDTPPEQGALTLVPGFQHRIADWLQTLPADAAPQQQNLHALGSHPVGARAGDMVIWNQLLPHGSRPNLGERPRIVQYINMLPGLIPAWARSDGKQATLEPSILA